MVELSYIILLTLSNIISAVILFRTCNDYFLVSFLCVAICLVYIMGYKFYLKTRIYHSTNKVNVKVNIKRLHVLILFLTLATLLFSIKTGVGVSEQDNKAAGSQIFSFFNINAIFMLYYIIGRRKKSYLYWINILIYAILKLSQGWTGILFHIFMYECYFRIRKNNRKRQQHIFLKSIVIVLFVIFIGGLVYSFVSPLKYAIRYGSFSNFTTISFWEAINSLVSRFSILPSAYRSVKAFDNIIGIYQKQPYLAEIQAMWRPIIPRTFMPFKEFYSMGSSVAAGISGIMNYSISDSPSVVIYAVLLFKADNITFLLWAVFYIISFIFMYKMLKCLQMYSGEFSIFYLFLIMIYLETGNVETMFMQTYFKIIFFIPLFYFLGIIKFKKRTSALKLLNCARERPNESITHNTTSSQ